MSTERPKPFDGPTSPLDVTRVDQPAVLPSLQTNTRPFRLEQIGGPGAPREFRLELDEVIVGRSLQAHIAIESGSISRRHMRLHREGPEYSFADLDSANGVYLNGVKAHAAVLRDGDQLQVGDVVFRYREGQ
jgi:pSer/pThr/pTyr-binding forkhead associated (FHA) protein